MGRWQGLEQTGPEAEKGFLNVWSNLGSLSPQQSQDCLHTQGISKPLPFSELSTQCLCVRVSVCAHTRSGMSDSSVTPWTVGRQSPLSMAFPRQEWVAISYPMGSSRPRD